jgi:hypothetical protein
VSEQEVDRHNATQLWREVIDRISVAAEEIGNAAGLADDLGITGYPLPAPLVDELTRAETALDTLLEHAEEAERKR